MGQALRRATGKVKSTSFDPPQPQGSIKKVDRRTPSVSAGSTEVPPSAQDRLGEFSDPEDLVRYSSSRVLEERDPGYDAMLGKMVGRISSKPGGKLEMGEAFIVEKYNRPLPKVRTSKAEIDQDAQSSTPPGTLDIKQLKQILLLHEGKSEEHQGAMTVDDIAKRFRIDTSQVQNILQFVALPPEDSIKNKNTQQ